MKRQRAGYQVVPYPKYRRWMVDMFRSARDKSMTHRLFEVDVTEARSRLSERQATTGESLSFTAFLATCVAKAVDESKAVQAYRQGRKRLVLFDDVDVWAPVEHDVAGRKLIIPTMFRAANHKTVREIHQEIRRAQMRDMAKTMKGLRYPPSLLFRPFFWLLSRRGGRDPRVWKQAVGTVGITAVGMFGDGAGWGIPIPTPTFMVTVGGIGAKPASVDGSPAVREYLSLTVSVDHEIVANEPTARFIQRLKALIESAYGLDRVPVAPEHARTESAPPVLKETFP